MSTMSVIRSTTLSLATSALWPSYLLVLSYAAKFAPWPRSFGRLVAFLLVVAAAVLYAHNVWRSILGAKGWALRSYNVPIDVIRRLRWARGFLTITAGLFLLPSQILAQGLLAPGGQPIYAHTVGRLLILAFELSFLYAIHRVVRHDAPPSVWLTGPDNPFPRLGRHRRLIAWSLLVGTGLLIAVDTQGYGFTARRLAAGLAQTAVVIAAGFFIERALMAVITRNAWRRIEPHSSLSANDHSHGSRDLSHRLRGLVRYGVPFVGLAILAWIWELDLAFFRYVSEQRLWSTSAETFVTVGDFCRAIAIFAGTALLWKNLATIFALVVYPRISDDPGVRFAVLTLCRYAVLAGGVLAGFSALDLGLDKVGMVLAALGVGLGFGLQEIVSNFVSGLILLLERPLRVGDIVTVSEMTGKVDRINIRATTLINADNQSMIIPNRQFVTGNLVNWTHKDKIIRVVINVAVAHGTDPDRVSDLLLAIAREDADVLGNPVSTAMLEEIGPGVLIFSLQVYVPDPSVAGRVKHRLASQIQKRFRTQGIEIPVPKQELKFQASDFEALIAKLATGGGIAAGAAPAFTPSTPHLRIDRPAPNAIIE